MEYEDGRLIFVNLGSFILESIEKVIEVDMFEMNYCNLFLVNVMVSLNILDLINKCCCIYLLNLRI